MVLVPAAGPALVLVAANHIAAVTLVSPAPVRSASRVVVALVVEALGNSLRAKCTVFHMCGLLGGGVSGSSIRSKCSRPSVWQSGVEDNVGVNLVHDVGRHGGLGRAGGE